MRSSMVPIKIANNYTVTKIKELVRELNGYLSPIFILELAMIKLKLSSLLSHV